MKRSWCTLVFEYPEGWVWAGRKGRKGHSRIRPRWCCEWHEQQSKRHQLQHGKTHVCQSGLYRAGKFILNSEMAIIGVLSRADSPLILIGAECAGRVLTAIITATCRTCSKWIFRNHDKWKLKLCRRHYGCQLKDLRLIIICNVALHSVLREHSVFLIYSAFLSCVWVISRAQPPAETLHLSLYRLRFLRSPQYGNFTKRL